MSLGLFIRITTALQLANHCINPSQPNLAQVQLADTMHTNAQFILSAYMGCSQKTENRAR